MSHDEMPLVLVLVLVVSCEELVCHHGGGCGLVCWWLESEKCKE